jgi:hypothetical protein
LLRFAHKIHLGLFQNFSFGTAPFYYYLYLANSVEPKVRNVPIIGIFCMYMQKIHKRNRLLEFGAGRCLANNETCRDPAQKAPSAVFLQTG